MFADMCNATHVQKECSMVFLNCISSKIINSLLSIKLINKNTNNLGGYIWCNFLHNIFIIMGVYIYKEIIHIDIKRGRLAL